MKVCIVYPPYWSVENQPGIKPVSDNYGVYPNLSLAYVAASLEYVGHSVRFIDGNALGLSKEQIVDRINRYKPDLLAFTVNTYMIHQNMGWIRYIKERVNVPVIIGGAHLSLYPKETFEYKEIDYGIIGEAEETVVDLVDALEKRRDLSKVDSIVFRNKDGKVIITGTGRTVKELDGLPFPARHLLPNDRYYEFISQRRNFTIMMTSRGCPFQCIYCEQGNTKFRGRSAKDIGDEIEECYTDYKIREADIFDPLFTTFKKRVMEISKDLQQRKLDFEWCVRSRVDKVDTELLTEMKKAGCSRIYFGIETGNQEIMDRLKKGVKLQQVRDAVKATQKAGIKALGYFMVGLPGETIETINQTINFSKELNLDYAQFSKVSPLPGTELYDKLLMAEMNGNDYWKRYVNDEKIEMPLTRPGCDLDEAVIQKMVKKAYSQFYFRPGYVIKAIKRTRSIDEFKRSAKAALDIFKFKPSEM